MRASERVVDHLAELFLLLPQPLQHARVHGIGVAAAASPAAALPREPFARAGLAGQRPTRRRGRGCGRRGGLARERERLGRLRSRAVGATGALEIDGALVERNSSRGATPTAGAPANGGVGGFRDRRDRRGRRAWGSCRPWRRWRATRTRTGATRERQRRADGGWCGSAGGDGGAAAAGRLPARPRWMG